MVNKTWASSLIPPKSLKVMDSHERNHWRMNVEYAIQTHDIGSLKKLLPTPEDLLSFTSGQFGHYGSVLHYCMYEGLDKKDEMAEGTRLDFVKSIFKEYDLDNHPEIKQKLLQRRNIMGKLAADFTYFEKIDTKNKFEWFKLRGENEEGEYSAEKYGLILNKREDGTIASIQTGPTITDLDQEKIELYHFLKDQIKSVRPKPTIEEIQVIGENYDDVKHNPNARGVPVTGGCYIPDADGKPALFVMDSVKETYPEIRLRNLNEQNVDVKDLAILKNLDPNSPKSLVSQAMDKIDFPEDFQQHFKALQYFEKGYKKIREDEGQFASIRYFVENRGNLIFEDKEDKDAHVSCGNYAGYATEIGRGENKHSLVVIRSDMASEDGVPQTVLHEIFHRVDLHDAKNNNHFSDAPLVKYALMLAQRNNSNNFTTLDAIEKSYLNIRENFSLEAVAYLMQRDKSEYKDNPLLFRLYVLGQQFSRARADEKMGMAHRLKYALDDMPEAEELKSEYQQFITEKEDHQKKIKQVEDTTIGDEAKAKKDNLNKQQADERKKNNDAFTPRRQQLEEALCQKMDELIRINGKLLTHPYGEIVIPPHLLSYRFGTHLPEEVIYRNVYDRKLSLSSFLDGIEHVSERPNELGIYAAYLAAKRDDPNDTLPIEPLQDIKDFDKWVSKMHVIDAYIQNPELSSKRTEKQYALSIGKVPSDWTNRDRLNYELQQCFIRSGEPNDSLDYFNPKESFQRLAEEYETIYHQPMPDYLGYIQEAKRKIDPEEEGFYTFGSDSDLKSSYQNILKVMDKRIRPEILNQMMHTAAETENASAIKLNPRGIPESELYMPTEETQESGVLNRLKNLSDEGKNAVVIENGQSLRTLLSQSSSKGEGMQEESVSKTSSKTQFKAPVIPPQAQH